MSKAKYLVNTRIRSASQGKTFEKGAKVSVDAEIGDLWVRGGLATKIESKQK